MPANSSQEAIDPQPQIPPPASAPPELHADWLELQAVLAADGNSAIQDLVSEIRRTGSIDALPSEDDTDDDEIGGEVIDAHSEKSQAIVEDAFSEIEHRARSCGPPYAYPFSLGDQHLQVTTGFESLVYTFLLTLSKYGLSAGPPGIDVADLFDRICASAAQEYLGGPAQGAESYLFGFPRRLTAAGFAQALDELCILMGEGGMARNRPTRRNQKDGKLDIVAWRGFPDKRSGKLIAFGQCATGGNWRSKVSELQARAFCVKWMRDMPSVDPVRMFFLPMRLTEHEWDDASIDAGIVFDRCRITSLSQALDASVLKECARWTRAVIKSNRK